MDINDQRDFAEEAANARIAEDENKCPRCAGYDGMHTIRNCPGDLDRPIQVQAFFDTMKDSVPVKQVEYRIKYIPHNADGKRGIYYTGTTFDTEQEAIESAERMMSYGHKVKIEQRVIGDWVQVPFQFGL